MRAEANRVELVEAAAPSDAEDPQHVIDRCVGVAVAVRAGNGDRPLIADAAPVFGLDHREPRRWMTGQLCYQLRDNRFARKRGREGRGHVEELGAPARRLPVRGVVVVDIEQRQGWCERHWDEVEAPGELRVAGMRRDDRGDAVHQCIIARRARSPGRPVRMVKFFEGLPLFPSRCMLTLRALPIEDRAPAQASSYARMVECVIAIDGGVTETKLQTCAGQQQAAVLPILSSPILARGSNLRIAGGPRDRRLQAETRLSQIAAGPRRLLTMHHAQVDGFIGPPRDRRREPVAIKRDGDDPLVLPLRFRAAVPVNQPPRARFRPARLRPAG
jgi:hypothetical protein